MKNQRKYVIVLIITLINLKNGKSELNKSKFFPALELVWCQYVENHIVNEK